MNRLDEAIRVALETADSQRLMVLSWLLATSTSKDARDVNRAIELAQRACEMTDFKDFKTLDTLAAVYAVSGNYDSAVKWSEQAIALLADDSDPQLRDRMLNALAEYRSRRPSAIP
jgi:tetratricopeptide (TPR) repeat protein